MRRSLLVLNLLAGGALLAGCGGGDNNGSSSNSTASTPATSVSTKVSQDVMASVLSSLQNANVSGAVPRERVNPSKATVNIEVNGNSATATATFNDPMVVQSGSAVLTGTLTMDLLVSAQAMAADVQVDLTATYSQATLVCDDGAHVVNGSFMVNGPMDLDYNIHGTTVTLTGSWSWEITSASLTIDGVAYEVDLVFSGEMTYPGSMQASLVGTVNGQTVNQSISATLVY